jgi:branched-chain amino acid transport system ATP-binding protein
VLLEVDQIDAGYGDFTALSGVSLQVEWASTVAVIGANGAGKSTLLKAIAGQLPLLAGDIRFEGVSLKGVAAHRRLRRGIALVPEGRRVFNSLTVDENLEIGAYSGRPGPWTKGAVYETFPLLARLAQRSAAKLSGGEQQALAIGRGLMSNPTLLLLDEVSLGLAPVVVRQLYATMPAIRSNGTALLIVEQNITQALAVADTASCLLEGRVSLAGPSSELSRDAVTAAYFGVTGRSA